MTPAPEDLSIVIPTRGRWDTLRLTLAALDAQTVRGFETIVVVDGPGDAVPELPGIRVLQQDHSGPGAARNRGVGASERRLVLFVGDDMVPAPELVARHLAQHDTQPADEVAVLGRIVWHPSVPRDRLHRWLDWSGALFDYRVLEEQGTVEAGWPRFYSSNVSLKRELFLAAGGFDPDFTFDYEDLDFGWRLGRLGLRLIYEPAAVVRHLHPYDWQAVERRYASRAAAERLMMAKHDWFKPWFHGQVEAAAGAPAASEIWTHVVDWVPPRAGGLRRFAEKRANRHYLQRLAPAFLAAWEEPEVRRTSLYQNLLAEILDQSHRYAPGVEQHRPTQVGAAAPMPRRAARLGRERLRDSIERVAGRAGFSRRHFDPQTAAARLGRVAELSEGLEATSGLLADDASRRALLDLLELRVLGPYHAPLRITPMAYRAKQAEVDRRLRIESATFEVSDPWFSPLSLYRVPVPGGTPVTLHSHSVDVVSVFLLHQYTYEREGHRAGAKPGDVVLDVGGCWGDTALYFASLVGPGGKVYTFEFDPESLAILRTNLSLNPELAGRVEIVERALWDTSGQTLGVVQAGRMTHVTSDGRLGPELQVPTVTVDDFIEGAGLDRLDFVKIDVEGAEMSVLRGARGSLAELTPDLAIAAYHRDDDLVRIPELIDSLGLGYRLFLDTYSPVEEETVLFATARNSST